MELQGQVEHIEPVVGNAFIEAIPIDLIFDVSRWVGR